ncbi:MAG: Endo-1,4-beta-xylanase A, partial [uncultured Sulfurovum sp.]
MMKVIVLGSLLLLLVGCGSESQVVVPTETETVLKSTKTKYEFNSSLSGITKHFTSDKTQKELEKAQKHWYKENKIKTNQIMKGLNTTSLKGSTLFDTLNVGYGGASAYGFHSEEGSSTIWMSTIDLALNPYIGNNGYYQGIKDFEPSDFSALQQQLKNSKYVIYWLPKYWSEWWFSTSQIQSAMDAGYVPVFMYWYFGDHLIEGLPTQTEIDAYYANNAKVSNFLSQLNGEKMIIMEPEFNKNAIVNSTESQNAFASIMSTAIDNVKVNNADMLVSLCMTDAGSRGANNTASYCGYENCALGDQYSWSRPESIYNQLSDKIDFVSFQEMVAQFSRDPYNPGTWSTPN